jgi:hypothetical protein
MNPKIKRVNEIAAQMRALFPEMRHMQLTLMGDTVELTLFGHKTYWSAVETYRELGIQKREKRVADTYTVIRGSVDGVIVRTFPDELPPTCHKEKYVERVPKTQMVDTGEFIEIERERIVCGNDDDETP